MNRMINSELRGVEFWSINTDAQALSGARSSSLPFPRGGG